MSYRGVAPSFVFKIDHRFPKTGDFKSSGKKYTLESEITKLILYSNCETKLNIVMWKMSPEEVNQAARVSRDRGVKTSQI